MPPRSLAVAAGLLALPSPSHAFLSFPSASPPPPQYPSQCLRVASPVVDASSSPAAFLDVDPPTPPPPEAAGAVAPGDDAAATDAGRSPSSAPSPAASPAAPARRPRVLPNGGTLALVGAGPGSPDLLTVAAHRIISDPSSFVIVDRLVSQEIRDLIAGEHRVANKHPGCQGQAQEEIYAWCKEGLAAGRQVVRLKIGACCARGVCLGDARRLLRGATLIS